MMSSQYSQIVVGMNICAAQDLIDFSDVSSDVLDRPSERPTEGSQTQGLERLSDTQSVPSSQVNLIRSPLANRQSCFVDVDVDEACSLQQLSGVMSECDWSVCSSGGVCQVSVIPVVVL